MAAEDNKKEVGQEDALTMQDLTALMRLAREQQNGVQNPASTQVNEDGGIDLIALFWFLLYKIKYIVLACLIGALLGGVYAQQCVHTVYSATSKLYIRGQSNSTFNISDLQLGSMLTMDYQEVFKTWEVHQKVLDMLKRDDPQLNYTTDQLQGMITVNNPNNTRVLYITARNRDPVMVVKVANAYAAAAREFILQTMDAQAPNEFSTAISATPITKSKRSYVIKGFLAGMAVVLAILVLIFLLDDRPKSADDILNKTGMNTLTMIPAAEKAAIRKKRSGRRNGK